MKTSTKTKITFSIFNEATYKTRHITISRSLLVLASIFLVIVSTSLGVLFFKYNHLRQATTHPLSLKNKIDYQKQKISTHDQQLGLLNTKYDQLSQKISKLQQLENQIRQIARIKPSLNKDNLFGVGGSKAETTRQKISSTNPENPGVPHPVRRAPVQLAKAAPLAQNQAGPGILTALTQSDFSLNPITCRPAMLPVSRGTIQKRFQSYPSPFTSQKTLNKGLAIEADQRLPVVSPANGIVAYANTDNNGLASLVIDHGHGFSTRYANIDALSKKSGENVTKGETVGYLQPGDKKPGKTDNQPLCYELFLNGIQVNPELFISPPKIFL